LIISIRQAGCVEENGSLQSEIIRLHRYSNSVREICQPIQDPIAEYVCPVRQFSQESYFRVDFRYDSKWGYSNRVLDLIDRMAMV
jgi:hypothetical protein